MARYGFGKGLTLTHHEPAKLSTKETNHCRNLEKDQKSLLEWGSSGIRYLWSQDIMTQLEIQ